jgi:cardiolipin synthase
VKIRAQKRRSCWPSQVWTALGSAAATALFTRNFLEVEKRIDRLVPVDYGPKDPRFRRTMSQLLGPPLLEGNSVTTLQNGAQIFPAMLAEIRTAKRSISFENFIFYEGNVCGSIGRTGARRRESAFFAGCFRMQLLAWRRDESA